MTVEDSSGAGIILSSLGNRGFRVETSGFVEMMAFRTSSAEKCANLGATCIEKYGYSSKYSFFPYTKKENNILIKEGFKYSMVPNGNINFLNLEDNKVFSLFEIDSDEMYLSAFSKSIFNKNSFVIRIYNPMNIIKNITLSVFVDKKFQVYKTNGREEIIEKLSSFSNNKVSLKINGPIETFYLEEL